MEAREIDRVAVLGQNRPQAVFEIMGYKGELSPTQLELRARFSEGLADYRRRQWDDARSAFEAALAVVPDDGPSITFIRRLDKFLQHPPAENWHGSGALNKSSTRGRIQPKSFQENPPVDRLDDRTDYPDRYLRLASLNCRVKTGR